MGLSTHILDTSIGCPVADISITLSRWNNGAWLDLGSGRTDMDGRCKSLLSDHPLECATYKLHFATADYFAAQRLTSLYPFVEITFIVTDALKHHHIPLLLAANGYTTYRGS